MWVVVGVAAVGVVAALVSGRALTASRAGEARLRAEVHALSTRVQDLEAVIAAAEAAAPRVDEAAAGSLTGETLVEEPTPALTDPITGLFNEQFFRVTLDTRVSAARRHLRPVAVVLLQVASGVRDGATALVEPDLVASGIRETLRDADTACRLEDGRFALILEDTPENGAVWTVERIRRFLAGDHHGQTLWAGIACYPAHAFDAWELFDRAGSALSAAKEWHQDRIEVATSE